MKSQKLQNTNSHSTDSHNFDHSDLDSKLGGRFAFKNTALSVRRMGYGAMQLAGPGVYGQPKDRQQAIAVLREAIEAGVDHIDTSDFYGPHITNQIIREALHPYPKNLVIVSKLGAIRPPDRSWKKANSADDLRAGVEGNLMNLGIDAIDIVNYRVIGKGQGPEEGSVAEPIHVLADLKKQGLIRNIGISNATPTQVAETQSITDIVCVQNYYNVAFRHDDDLIDQLNKQGIAYVPFFPLGGFTPLQSSILNAVAERTNATPMQVALAGLLQRSPNILLIPGTSSPAHLRENLSAAQLKLTSEAITELNGIAKSEPAGHH